MISKVTVARVSAVLFLGGLVVLLIGLTISPRFANASGSQDCLGLVGKVFGCDAENGGDSLELAFFSTNESSLSVIGETNNTTVIDADCVCTKKGKVKCRDVHDDSVKLQGQVDNTSLREVKIIMPGQGSVRYTCEEIP